jgi:hypothetical protein
VWGHCRSKSSEKDAYVKVDEEAAMVQLNPCSKRVGAACEYQFVCRAGYKDTINAIVTSFVGGYLDVTGMVSSTLEVRKTSSWSLVLQVDAHNEIPFWQRVGMVVRVLRVDRRMTMVRCPRWNCRTGNWERRASLFVGKSFDSWKNCVCLVLYNVARWSASERASRKDDNLFKNRSLRSMGELHTD